MLPVSRTNSTSPRAAVDRGRAERAGCRVGEQAGRTAADPDSVTATFRITVSNGGPSVATGVVVDDPGPAGAAFVSATPSQGNYNPATGQWSVGTLPVGASATLVISFTGPATNNLFNRATVSGDQPDPDPDNNLDGDAGQHDPSDPDRLIADLSMTKTVDNLTPRVGDEITYRLSLLNSGPSTTAGVSASDELPGGVDFVSARVVSEAGRCRTCGYNDSLGVWIVGHLPRDSSAVLEITVRVTGTGLIVNRAYVLESHLPDPDSRFGDDDLRDDDTDEVAITATAGNAITVVREGAAGVPLTYELEANYPNPFNPETVIPFGLPETSEVVVEVYNMLGQRVAVLLRERLEAGRHEVVWRALNQPSGLYLVRMRAGKVQKVQRVTLVK